MTLPQNNSPRIKTPLISILYELGVKLLGKEYSIQYSKRQWYSIKNVVEIPDENRCILFGPPRIGLAIRAKNNIPFGRGHLYTSYALSE